jgi:hypothetical protein
MFPPWSLDLGIEQLTVKRSILFLYRDRFLASPRAHVSPGRPGDDADQTIDHLFSTAQHIGAVLSSLDNCATPVITPYAGFSVFVAAHINMYGTVCPGRYPGGLERAEREKKSNLEYLERLSRFWDVATSWVCLPPLLPGPVSSRRLTMIVANASRGESVLRNRTDDAPGPGAGSGPSHSGWHIRRVRRYSYFAA